MTTTGNEKILVHPGVKIGRLTVGELVPGVKTHPCYETTPISYLRQGRLRECVCDCGEVRLVSETHLATGKIKSCGCLKKERKALSERQQISKLELKLQNDRIMGQLRMEQGRLKGYQNALVKDERKIAECAARIRELISQKASLKNFKRRAQQRNRYREAKLLSEVEELTKDL